jgi:hypothetical protein
MENLIEGHLQGFPTVSIFTPFTIRTDSLRTVSGGVTPSRSWAWSVWGCSTVEVAAALTGVFVEAGFCCEPA